MTLEDLSKFALIGVSPDLLSAAGVRRVSDAEARDEFGFRFSAAADLGGIVFPYFHPMTGKRVTARLRRDRPELGPDGKVLNKYISAYGDRRHLFFAPGAGSLLADTTVPVVIVESEKSSLALTALAERTSRKLLVVATGGCWGWTGRVGIETGSRGERQEMHGPLPDWSLIDWSFRRDTIICFDTNSLTNHQVRTARFALAQELNCRGESVRIAELPPMSGVNGPDDLIATSGDEPVLALLDSARPSAETAKAEAEAAVGVLETHKEQDPAASLDAVAMLKDPLHRILLIGRIVALKIPGLTKKVVEEAIEAQRTKVCQKEANAIERARQERLIRLPVNPAELLAELESYYSRRRHLPADVPFVEALFGMNTHIYDVFDTTPYLLYDSAIGGCGKTTALERHEHVCARAYLGVDPSAAVLYRRIERDRPTWLLDEARVLQNHGERGQELLALFDAGYKRGATVSRCEEHGEGLRDFIVFCPKALARIGSFRGTLLDRGIVIHLEKAHGLRQKRRNALKKEAAPLKEALEAYGLQYRAQLERLYKDESDEGYWRRLSGREEEVWGPLLCHARLAGPEIESRALKVALRYSRQKAEIAIAEDQMLALAQEALQVLRLRNGETFRPSELIPALSEKETWGEYLAERKSDKARVTAVGTFFSHFRLTSRKHTDAGTEYERFDAIEVIERHMPETPVPPEEGVRVSASERTDSDSIDYVADTSRSDFAVHVSPAHAVERKDSTAAPDTLTPQPGSKDRIIEGEL